MLRVLIVAGLVAVSTAFKTGAMVPPNRRMDSMCTVGNQRPRHTAPNGDVIMPMRTKAPVTLTAVLTGQRGPRLYGPGSVFRVTLKADRGKSFKGFFITADAEDASFGVKGRFEAEGNMKNLAKGTTYCSPGMTHSSSSPKTEVTIKYTAPANYTHGTIQFKATVVMGYAEFYTGVRSNFFRSQKTGGVKTESQYTEAQMNAMRRAFEAGGMPGMGAMGGAGGLGGLLGGFDLSGMMKNMMSNMGGGPMMNPQGGSPMNRRVPGMQG